MLGEKYTCAIQGTHCGAPFSVSLCYVQVQATENNGLDLATAWWADDGVSPGALWMDFSSNKLQPQCMSWSSPTDVGAALIADTVKGLIATAALPPVVATLFHIRPFTPWAGGNASKPKYDVGRFFLPGLTHSAVRDMQLTNAFVGNFRELGDAMLNIQVNAATAFRLVPFPKFEAPPGGEITARSCAPDALIRRIATRKPNLCELFAGTGQVGGRPIIGNGVTPP